MLLGFVCVLRGGEGGGGGGTSLADTDSESVSEFALQVVASGDLT